MPKRLSLLLALLAGSLGVSMVAWTLYASFLAPRPVADTPDQTAELVVEEVPSSGASGSIAAPATVPPTAGSQDDKPGLWFAPRSASEDLLVRMNAERAVAGSGKLILDPSLDAFAAEWVEKMAAGGYKHSSRERLEEILATASLASVAENIHAPEPQCPFGTTCSEPAFQPTTGVLHVDWMHSPSHRATVLQPAWSRVGVGIACDADGRMWAVVLFGSAPGTVRDAGFAPSLPELEFPGNDGVLCDGGFRETNPSWRHTAPG